MAQGISDAADTLIINEETGGQAYYEKTEIHPDWPGGASGVTIGIGYDLGYSTAAQIASDWGGVLSADVVSALQSVAGITGSAARSHAQELHSISVPWDSAIAVFRNKDEPKWIAFCAYDLPNFGELSGDCAGALVSLAFNRGRSWNTPAANDPNGRYREMRAIKQHMADRNYAAIPAEFLSMRRLWPQGGDLWRRRGHEADLFTQGLAAMNNPSNGG